MNKLVTFFVISFFLFVLAQTALAEIFTDCAFQSSIPQAECQALVDLYDNNNGEEWMGIPGWKSEPDPCNWSGVICSGGHVAELNLSKKYLTGSIPPTIKNLDNMNYLVLTNAE